MISEFIAKALRPYEIGNLRKAADELNARFNEAEKARARMLNHGVAVSNKLASLINGGGSGCWPNNDG